MSKNVNCGNIEEQLMRNLNNFNYDNMKRNIFHENQDAESNLNNSSDVTENINSAGTKKYLVVTSDNKQEILGIEKLDPKVSAITKLFENTDLIIKLLNQAYSVLHDCSYGKPFVISPKELLSQIKTGLLSGDLKWDIQQYPSTFSQFSYYIKYQIRKTYRKEAKYYKTEGLADVKENEIYDAKFFATFGVEFDVNGKLHSYTSRKEFDKFNRFLAIDNWLRKYCSELDRNIFTLLRINYTRSEIAKIYNIDKTIIYNLFRRMKYYFKKHPIR